MPRYFNPAAPESGQGTNDALPVFGGSRDVRRRGRSSPGGLTDEQDSRGRNPDETEREDGKGERAHGVRESASKDRSDDEPGSEDDRIDPEGRAGHGTLHDVSEVGECGGRERAGSGREEGDQRPLGRELVEVRAARPRGRREQDGQSSEAGEADPHERSPTPGTIGPSTAEGERETERDAERTDDDQELGHGGGPSRSDQVVGEAEDVPV